MLKNSLQKFLGLESDPNPFQNQIAPKLQLFCPDLCIYLYNVPITYILHTDHFLHFMVVCVPLNFLDQFISNMPYSLDGWKPENKEFHHEPEQELDNYSSPKLRSFHAQHAQWRKLLSCFSRNHKKVHLFPLQDLCFHWRASSIEMEAEYAGKRRVKVTVWNNLWGFSAHKQMIACHQDEFRWHLYVKVQSSPLHCGPSWAED